MCDIVHWMTKITAINRLLVQNNVTGCTMMINRPLLEKALKLSNISAIAMHDWWFSLVASLFGEISFIDQATIKYRQHGDNVVGATKVNTPSFILQRLRGKNHIHEVFSFVFYAGTGIASNLWQ